MCIKKMIVLGLLVCGGLTLDAQESLYVNGGLIISENAQLYIAGDLQLATNAVLSVKPGATLELAGNLSQNATTPIRLEANANAYAQMKFSGSFSGSGSVDHQMYFKGGWHMVAASMNATTAGYFGAVGANANGGTSNTQNLFSWDGNKYVNLADNDASISPGQGYFGFVGDFGFRDDGDNSNTTGAGTYTFNGAPNTSVSPSLTYLTATAPLSAGTAEGWNLIANPFTCALDFSSISLSNVNDAFYIYNPLGSYEAVSPAGISGTDIAPMQSFWVQASAGSPSLGTLTMAANGSLETSPTFYKRNFERLLLKTRALQDSSAVDHTIVSFVGAGTSKNYDGAWDAHKLLNAGNFPNIYSKQQGQEMAINAIDFGPNHPQADSIEISFQAPNPNAGELYEISIDKSYMMYPYDILLEDKKMGSFTDLNQTTYQFPYDTNFVDRFVLHFSSQTVGLDQLANRKANALQVWLHQGQVHYLANYQGQAQLALLDLSGRMLWSATVDFEKDQAAGLSLNQNLPAGIYLLRSQELQGPTQTQKVYVK